MVDSARHSYTYVLSLFTYSFKYKALPRLAIRAHK